MAFYAKLFFNSLLFIVVKVRADLLESENLNTFDNIFDFSVGFLNESDNVSDYASKIQAVFCPKQPICTAAPDQNRTDVLNTLPEIIEIGTENYRIEDVHKFVGTCCLPCSCDRRTCTEDGNCCLSKIIADAIENNSDIDHDQNAIDVLSALNEASEQKDENEAAIHSECIKASWLSYRDKNAYEIEDDLDIPSYFMITRCFENHASQVEVTKCQNPTEYDELTMLPVRSSDTGRIYWNVHCARCNNDGRHITQWNASVRFDTDIAYFKNTSDIANDYGSSVYPDKYSDIPGFISKTGNILYTPPFAQEDKLCLRKNTLLTCKIEGKEPTGSWLEKACEAIYSPLIIESVFGRIPYLNIFCYLCRREYIKPKTGGTCGYDELYFKGTSEGMGALLDYKAPNDDNNALTISTGQDKCGCEEIYDPTIHTCRRVHCPASEYMVNCKCKQPFKGVYGMRILLTIKLIPRSGYLTTLKTKQIANFNNALEESLHTITENIFIDLIGLFECHADFGDYYLFFVVVRSHPGYDTKEVIEPFLDYMDNKRKVIEMVDNKQSTYEVRLTSRIRLWNTYNYTSYSLNFRDLESTVQNYSTIFSTDALLDAYYQEFQVLSPLLYCMQVQLNENEFEETDGQLTTLRTTRKTTISYYHRTSPSTVRVCEDQYINKNIGIRVSHSNFYLYVLLVFGCGAFHVF